MLLVHIERNVFYGSCFRPVRWFSATMPAVLLKSQRCLTSAHTSCLPTSYSPAYPLPLFTLLPFDPSVNNYVLIFLLLAVLLLVSPALSPAQNSCIPACNFCSLSSCSVSFLLSYCSFRLLFFLLQLHLVSLHLMPVFLLFVFLLLAVLMLIPPALLSSAYHVQLISAHFPPVDFLLLAVLLLILLARLSPANNS
jgi:hypothetical protein